VAALEFSCLLPVYAADDPALFAQAAHSIERSTLRPAETLICQDGAVPATLAAEVERLSGAGRFRVVVNPGPRGLHHNLNHAARSVRTAWIARMDADDINLEERFAAQAAVLAARPQIDVLGGAILEVAADGRQQRRLAPLEHAAIVRRARWRNPMNHMTVMMRLERFLEAGGYPDIPCKEDYGLWLALIARGAVFANLPEDLVRVRLGASFEARRAGLQNLTSEYALWRLRRRLPGLGGPQAALACAVRSGALASRRGAQVLYRRVLR
jgi:glycosyltransferase involved in cell wall biosynthesis